ncbi:coiled-coil domain-containing protein 170 [Arapaima gigas]
MGERRCDSPTDFRQNRSLLDIPDAERRYQEFALKLADRSSTRLRDNEDPMDFIVSLMDTLCEEKERQRAELRTLKESVASGEVECKAGRRTVMRLVAEVRREQQVSAARTAELQSLRQEFERAMKDKEVENRGLREKLQASQRSLTESQQEASRLEGRTQELETSLRSNQKEAQVTQGLLWAFAEEVAALVRAHNKPRTGTEEEEVQRKLREKRSWEEHGAENTLDMEARLSHLLGDLDRLLGLHQETLQRAQSAERRAQELEAELLSASMFREDCSRERQDNQRFLEQLSDTLKLDSVTAEVGLDLKLEAILLRAEQLVKQEGSSLVETKSLVYSLQRKLKNQKECLESKELHVDMLRKKVSQLEEEKRKCFTLAMEQSNTQMEIRKLQKKVERLQKDLNASRNSNLELRAQLSHTNELKIKVIEQRQIIEDQSKILEKMQKEKRKAADGFTMEKSQLESKYREAKAEQEQAQQMLESSSDELRILKQRISELAEKERQLTDFRKVVSQMLGLDLSSLALPDYEIIKTLESLLHSSHHAHQEWLCPSHPHSQLT